MITLLVRAKPEIQVYPTPKPTFFITLRPVPEEISLQSWEMQIPSLYLIGFVYWPYIFNKFI